MIFTLLGLIAIMFILQSVLGYGQLKDFNKNYNEMRCQNKVSIGRSKGLVTTGVVLLMRIDQKARIIETRKMQGTTIFARFKTFEKLNGKQLLKIDEETLAQVDRFTRKAIRDAQHTYRIIQAGGEPPKPASPVEKLLNLFKKKGEVSRL
ncbi:transcriptional regulator GutM [Halobacillus sp. Marseille-Q1614]|uniref:transcriptional regulator GutM n=1 Tax=Halobacillus sp. Marseille-Q1614 TaxID=2709134 RepID=UPI0015708A4D|nr:transcriptional regulator GutM [Halobacillus sp. Marseille-Q1614]